MAEIPKDITIKPSIPDNLPDLPEMNLPDTWGEPSANAKTAIKLAHRTLNTRHGLFASVPLVCRGNECPYHKTCVAVAYGVAPVGERCAIEIATIQAKFKAYCDELEIDSTKIVNIGLVKELIDCEIMIERCNQLLASSGEMITEVVAAVTDGGRAYYKPEIHKAIEIKDRNLRRKSDLLQLLNSTPKDKAKMEGAKLIDPSQYASEILEKYMNSMTVVDAEFEVVEGDKD